MNRIISFDLARGLTVLFIPSIHVFMLCARPVLHHSPIGHVLIFIAEWPGAQLFMVLMGLYIGLGKTQSTRAVIKRSAGFLAMGYALNLFKFVLPYHLGILPDTLVRDISSSPDPATDMFFLGDILQFAAIAYPLTVMVSRNSKAGWIAVVIAITILAISPFTWDLQTGYAVPDYFLTLLSGHPPQVFFPLFPWLIYPLAGLSLGYWLRKVQGNWIIRHAGVSGMGLMLIGWVLSCSDPQPAGWPSFYRTGSGGSLLHLGFILTWLMLFYRQSITEKKAPALLLFCSRNITVIYITQWLLIAALVCITGYAQLSLIPATGCALLITSLTLFITWLIKNGKNNL